jgi:cobalamin biosynthesis protein CobD/CbiB
MALPLKQVSQWGEYGLLIWLAVLLAVVTYRGLVSGKLRDLVAEPRGGGVSPARLQALGVTIGFAGYYLTAGLQAVAEGAASLPNVKPETLSIVAASLGVHMGGKLYERHPRRTAGSHDGAEPKPRRPKSGRKPKP